MEVLSTEKTENKAFCHKLEQVDLLGIPKR